MAAPSQEARLAELKQLASMYTPFYTIAELATIIGEFIEFLDHNEAPLVETGYPGTVFSASGYLDTLLGELYPVRVCLNAFADRSDPKEIALRRTWSPNIPTSWRRHALSEGGFSSVASADECSYEEAGLLIGLDGETVANLEDARPRLLTLKRRSLGVLRDALTRNDSTELWQKCLSIFFESFSSEDLRFFLKIDALYDGFNTDHWKQEVSGGGLWPLQRLIFHVEKELTLGTLTKTRIRLGEIVRLVPRGESEWYASFHATDDANVADLVEAAELRDGLLAQEAGLWKEFVRRLNNDFKQELLTEVSLPNFSVQGKYARVVGANVRRYAEQQVSNLEMGLTPDDAEVEGQTVAKTPGVVGISRALQAPAVGDMETQQSADPFLVLSPDYRRVSLRGEIHDLTGKQAEVIEFLHAAHENGTAPLSQDYILTTLNLGTSRLSDVFRSRPNAWKNLISRPKPAFFGLNL